MSVALRFNFSPRFHGVVLANLAHTCGASGTTISLKVPHDPGTVYKGRVMSPGMKLDPRAPKTQRGKGGQHVRISSALSLGIETKKPCAVYLLNQAWQICKQGRFSSPAVCLWPLWGSLLRAQWANTHTCTRRFDYMLAVCVYTHVYIFRYRELEQHTARMSFFVAVN